MQRKSVQLRRRNVENCALGSVRWLETHRFSAIKRAPGRAIALIGHHRHEICTEILMDPSKPPRSWRDPNRRGYRSTAIDSQTGRYVERLPPKHPSRCRAQIGMSAAPPVCVWRGEGTGGGSDNFWRLHLFGFRRIFRHQHVFFNMHTNTRSLGTRGRVVVKTACCS